MRHPPPIPLERMSRIVMSVLAGEVLVAEAARREKVSAPSIGNQRRQFLEARKSTLAGGSSGHPTREQQLELGVQELTQALGEAAVEIRVWRRSAEGQLGPSNMCCAGVVSLVSACAA